MSDSNLFYGPNAAFALDLYERYLQDPASVDAATRAYFASGHAVTLADAPPPVAARPFTPPAAATAPGAAFDPLKVAAAARLARFIRQRGHLAASVDPLGMKRPNAADLELNAHGLTTDDLARLPASVVGGPLAADSQNALDVIGKLRRVYSGSIGYDDEHIQNAEERYWLRDAAEGQRFFEGIDAAARCDLLQRMTEVEVFETYLDTWTQKAKRFSIEGTDMLVPMLDDIIHQAAVGGMREVVLAMAHRGRLNVLAHVLGKPYEKTLAEFAEAKRRDDNASVAGKGSQGWTGDVKYHLGARRAYKESGIEEMPLTLVPNPSHLEFVNPVAEGHARAAQEDRSRRGVPSQNVKVALPILIHGDAAFPGQGVVAETLNLSGLPGYTTGGTIHIIVNNQIGFTTLPEEGRSTTYASDLAKGFEIPIVHVNADDPMACLAAARMAFAYRARFQKDFLIDLVGYRRNGHNEGDQPRRTQPRMYEIIDQHPRVRAKWAKTLEAQGDVTRDEAEAMITAVRAKLDAARAAMVEIKPDGPDETRRGARTRQVETALPTERLIELNEALLTRPEGFTVHAPTDAILQRRRAALTTPGGISWAHAESLAFAATLADGIPIRLTGQDAERGTFDQRNLVLHDPTTGARYTPLESLMQSRAAFAVFNSPLSENAALGFEYGYSIHAPGVLILWEGQFGDFANGAQVIIDQFLVSGQAKWRQAASLVLLLPHGYEGQGPEHSSARLERFLQLCANDNMRVVNCTSAAQYFHLLRRQAALLETDPRPLIVMSPKRLLRDARAGSSLDALATGTFQPIIDDADARKRADRITRLVLCSGKMYVDLVASQEYPTAEGVAVVRVEELYPFPADLLRGVIAGYPNLEEIVWVQEEPENMGAWTFVAPRLAALCGWTGPLRPISRGESASPAEGSARRHESEQARIILEALKTSPALALAGARETTASQTSVSE